MRLDLREIISIPGGVVSFEYEPDLSDCAVGSIKEIVPPAKVRGTVKNSAGVLTLNAELDISAVFVCGRCLHEDKKQIHHHIKATLAEGAQDSEDPDVFPLDGNFADMDEIIVTAFILSTADTYLCGEGCKGLCPRCGADLNEGPCLCNKEIDPRLAVLGQFLEE